MPFALFLHVVCNISNFDMWTAKHLVQPACTDLTFKKSWKRSEQLTSSSKDPPKKMKTAAQITMVIIMIIRHASKTTVDPDVWLFPFPAGGGAQTAGLFCCCTLNKTGCNPTGATAWRFLIMAQWTIMTISILQFYRKSILRSIIYYILIHPILSPFLASYHDFSHRNDQARYFVQEKYCQFE